LFFFVISFFNLILNYNSKFEEKSIQIINKYNQTKVSVIYRLMEEIEKKNLIKLAIQANMKLFLSQDIINNYITDNTTNWFILFHFLYAVNYLFSNIFMFIILIFFF
jgi:hypothetical protein